MPRHVARGNARRARVRSRVEHVFAAQKRRFDLVIRTVGGGVHITGAAPAAPSPQIRTALRRRALAITETELRLIAAAAMIGLSRMPKTG